MEKFEFEALIRKVPRVSREEAFKLLNDNSNVLSSNQYEQLTQEVEMFFPEIKKR